MKYFSVLPLIFIFILTACSYESADENKYEDENIPNKVVSMVGKTYSLSEYDISGKPKQIKPKGYFTMFINSINQISGKMDCFSYSADVLWSEKGVLNISNLNITGSGCAAPEFQLEGQMYVIIPNNAAKIELISTDDEWSAIFNAD